jgi:hypothetical protein
MRTFEQFEAEVFSAVELKKNKVKKRKKLITAISLCLCVCLTVSVFALPILKDKGVTPDGANEQEIPSVSDNSGPAADASDDDGEVKGSTENSAGNSGSVISTENGNAAQDSNANFFKQINTISGPKYVVEEVYGMFFGDDFSPEGFTVFSDDSKYFFEFFKGEQTVTVKKAYSELTSKQAARLYEIIGF